MKRERNTMRDEYPADLIKSGVRGTHAERYPASSNVVLIDPDLHAIFPDSEAVNHALRDYLALRR